MLPAALRRGTEVSYCSFLRVSRWIFSCRTAEPVTTETKLPISTTDEQLHSELKEALSSSPELQVDYSTLPPTTPRDSVINS
jgi:hypothetical protein